MSAVRSISLAVSVVLIIILFTGGTSFIKKAIGKTDEIGTQTIKSIVDVPTSNIIVAMSDNEKLKDLWIKMIDLSSKKPHEVAMIQLTDPFTKEDLEYVESELKKTQIKTSTITALAGKCQLWLKLASPDKVEFFSDDPKILEKFYDSLAGDSITSSVKIYTISPMLKENLEMFAPICGEGGCTNMKKCAECAGKIEELETAKREGNPSKERDIEIELRQNGCARACASTCAGLYNSLNLLMGPQILDPEVRKTFISTGVQIS